MIVTRAVGALLIEEHSADCRMWSLFGAGCDCGASAVATKRIVEDLSAAFGADLAQIMAGENHCQQCAGPCLRRPRHGQAWS